MWVALDEKLKTFKLTEALKRKGKIVRYSQK
jgi:hypothetical protein